MSYSATIVTREGERRSLPVGSDLELAKKNLVEQALDTCLIGSACYMVITRPGKQVPAFEAILTRLTRGFTLEVNTH